MAWVNPKLDWVSNPKNPKSEDMNRIEGNIDFLKTDIETKKGTIVNAINDMGQTSTISDSYTTLGNKIKSISSDASATVAQVLVGATFYQGGVKKTGTMVNNGNITTSLAINGTYTIPQGYHGGAGKVSQAITTKSAQTFTPSTTNQTIASGQYLSGVQTISGSPNLVADNIKTGINIFGVVGNLQELEFKAGNTYVAAQKPDKSWSNIEGNTTVTIGSATVYAKGTIRLYGHLQVSMGLTSFTIQAYKNGVPYGASSTTADGDQYTRFSTSITVDIPCEGNTVIEFKAKNNDLLNKRSLHNTGCKLSFDYMTPICSVMS